MSRDTSKFLFLVDHTNSVGLSGVAIIFAILLYLLVGKTVLLYMRGLGMYCQPFSGSKVSTLTCGSTIGSSVSADFNSFLFSFLS